MKLTNFHKYRLAIIGGAIIVAVLVIYYKRSHPNTISGDTSAAINSVAGGVGTAAAAGLMGI